MSFLAGWFFGMLFGTQVVDWITNLVTSYVP